MRTLTRGLGGGYDAVPEHEMACIADGPSDTRRDQRESKPTPPHTTWPRYACAHAPYQPPGALQAHHGTQRRPTRTGVGAGALVAWAARLLLRVCGGLVCSEARRRTPPPRRSQSTRRAHTCIARWWRAGPADRHQVQHARCRRGAVAAAGPAAKPTAVARARCLDELDSCHDGYDDLPR